MFRQSIYVIFLNLCYICIEAREIPDYMHICKLSDPNFSKCVAESAESLQPMLANGLPDYNIPGMEPLVIEELISETSGGLHITVTDVKVRGASNFKVNNVTVDPATQRYDIDILLPNLLIDANYGVDGKILLLPIKGSGPMNANVTNVNAKVLLLGEVFEKDGGKYIKYNSMNISTIIGGGTGRLENLFNGDKVLGDVVNDSLNKNMEPLLKELLPVINKNLARVFLKIANNIVEPFTFDQLFPV